MSCDALNGKKITWHHFSALEENDFSVLEKEFKFHPLDFDDLREEHIFPKLDIYKHYLFSIFSVPFYLQEESIIKKLDLAIFIGNDYIVTVSRTPIESVERFFARARRSTGLRREILNNSSGYLVYRLLDYVFRDAKVVLQVLSRETQEIQEQVYSHHSQGTTRRLGLLRRDLLFFRHIIDPQRILLPQFLNTKKVFMPESLDIYFDDLKDTFDGMWVVADNLKNILDCLFDVNEAFLSHKTNEIIRILTIISVILMPPTLISSYYGMNIDRLPFAHSIELVSLIILFSLLVAFVLIIVLDKRR